LDTSGLLVLGEEKRSNNREVVGIISPLHVIPDNHDIFRCDPICMENPVDAVLAGFSGKPMMGPARCFVKCIVKGDARTFPGDRFIHKDPVMGRIKRRVEIAHKNCRDRFGALHETLHDESGAEDLNRRRKIEMGVDTGQPA